MEGNWLTVGQLKKELEKFPDDFKVTIPDASQFTEDDRRMEIEGIYHSRAVLVELSDDKRGIIRITDNCKFRRF